ncbi:TMV resistance protein N-like [Gossypium australe]|uniref:TMV resistance protein N-like n=1 Tax=Gossypium australe TaxID=47621 RepID=A0A5B6WKN6_9ROSI|nr:TMV resistance protein N-like [Gossypium australe]
MADLNLHKREAIEIMCDNQSAIAIAKNPVFHGRTKHFNIKLYFVREMEQAQEVKLIHCSFEEQLADILTKPLSVSRFIHLRAEMGICNMLAKEALPPVFSLPESDTEIYLRKEIKSKCLKCQSKKRSSGLSYVSSDGKLCYRVACLKEACLENWKKGKEDLNSLMHELLSQMY